MLRTRISFARVLSVGCLLFALGFQLAEPLVASAHRGLIAPAEAAGAIDGDASVGATGAAFAASHSAPVPAHDADRCPICKHLGAARSIGVPQRAPGLLPLLCKALPLPAPSQRPPAAVASDPSEPRAPPAIG